MILPLQVLSRIAKASAINMIGAVWPVVKIQTKLFLSGQSSLIIPPANNNQSIYAVDHVVVKSSIINPSRTTPFTFLVTRSESGNFFDPTGYNMSNVVACHQASPTGAGDDVIPQIFVSVLKFEHDQFIQAAAQPFNVYAGGELVPAVGNIFVSYSISIFYRLHN